MQEYSTIVIGPDGHIQYCIGLQCEKESEAKALAKEFAFGQDVELWQFDRKIETFSAR